MNGGREVELRLYSLEQRKQLEGFIDGLTIASICQIYRPKFWCQYTRVKDFSCTPTANLNSIDQLIDAVNVLNPLAYSDVPTVQL